MPSSSTFPTTLDTLPAITATTQENASGLEHDVVHQLELDAVAALEAKVGINSSTDHASVDWKLGDARSRLTTVEALASSTDAALADKADLVAGKIPSAQLPSYVDDVLEYANFAALPGTGETGKIYITLDDNAEYRWSGSVYMLLVASPGTTDAITEGTTNLYFTAARVRAVVLTGLSLATNAAIIATDTVLVAFGKLQKQLTDLITTVAGKLTANSPITGATKTKITYDVNGLVTGGADATTADIADSTDKRYVTDAQQTVLGNTSGTNTGDQNLSGYAPLASPALTGVPTAPTASLGTNTTQIATMAAVQAAINALLNGAPGALDTLKELADAINDDASYAATITTALAAKAPLASPALTGTPTVPTAAPGTNTTQAASTAFVAAAVAGGGGSASVPTIRAIAALRAF